MSLNSFRTGMENVSKNPFGKWGLWLVGALLTFGLVGFGLLNVGGLNGTSAQPAAARTGEDVVATVNGDPITRGDFDSAMQEVKNSPMLTGRTVGIAEQPFLNSLALEQLIAAKLQLQQAKSTNVPVSGAEIAAKRAEIVERANFRQTLSLPATASMADIDAALVKAGSQTIEQKLPDDTLRQIILLGDPEGGTPGKAQTAFNSTVVVSEADARQFYTKYHTRHILIDNKKRSDVQARAQAEQILAKAKAPGADFAALAKQYSDDPGTKAKGGDDGLIDENTQYIPEFKKAAFSLKPGEVTPDVVVSPQYGYFIIKLDSVKIALPADFEKNKAKYLALVRDTRAQAKYQELMASLKNTANIAVKDPALAGDRAFSVAGRSGMQGQSKYQEALTDYSTALKANPPATEKAAISAALAQVYQALHQIPQAMAAYEVALKSRDDASLELTLGKMYLDDKQANKAIPHFQQASSLAWNDQTTHIQLMMDYRQANRPDLVAKETDWLKTYAIAHPAPTSQAGMPGMMPGSAGAAGGMPVEMPGAPGARHAGSIHVTPSAMPKRPAAPTQ